MLNSGYNRSLYDSCVYLKRASNFIEYLLFYINDMLVVLIDKSKIDKLKYLLKEEFEMKDLGAVKRILGMEIRRNRSVRKLYLS